MNKNHKLFTDLYPIKRWRPYSEKIIVVFNSRNTRRPHTRINYNTTHGETV